MKSANNDFSWRFLGTTKMKTIKMFEKILDGTIYCPEEVCRNGTLQIELRDRNTLT